MSTSCLMFPSEVKCAFGTRLGTHHITATIAKDLPYRLYQQKERVNRGEVTRYLIPSAIIGPRHLRFGTSGAFCDFWGEGKSTFTITLLFYSCFLEWIYSLGDIPYCFLKALLKYEMLSNPHSRAMSMILSVVFNSIDSAFCSFNKRQYS